MVPCHGTPLQSLTSRTNLEYHTIKQTAAYLSSRTED
uniref:Uncharacterized protein n=1 Tax=Anguilla anguilla TaxID=7936 RepID=A0A0E9PGG6_ANGAN